MRTPAGKECRFFYGDYHRGRELEECRLLEAASPPVTWKRVYCETCPVPGILLANACQDLVLIPSLGKKLPFLKPQVRVTTYCKKTAKSGFDPHIGCGECHQLPLEFREGK